MAAAHRAHPARPTVHRPSTDRCADQPITPRHPNHNPPKPGSAQRNPPKPTGAHRPRDTIPTERLTVRQATPSDVVIKRPVDFFTPSHPADRPATNQHMHTADCGGARRPHPIGAWHFGGRGAPPTPFGTQPQGSLSVCRPSAPQRAPSPTYRQFTDRPAD